MKLTPFTYFRKKILPHIIAYTAKWTTKAILLTCKKEIHGLHEFCTTAQNNPCILMLWHNNLVIAPEILSNYAKNLIFTAFISNSRDGEPLAILVNSYTCGRVLRVPHNQRHTALHTMIGKLKEQKEVIIITPDGPRGPKYVLKPGIALAAKASHAHIVPFSWSATKFWQLGTWDAMKIPKPFSKITATFGQSIVIKEDVSEENAVEILRDALETGTNGP